MRTTSTWLAVLWTLIVFGICWTPRTMMPVAEDMPRPFFLTHLDKVVHAAIFAGFGFTWIAALPGRAGRVLAMAVAAATLSELGQATPLVNRDAEWADGLADVVGAVAGIAIYPRLRAALYRRTPSTSATVPSAGTP